ncbi:MAG TPA: hypothetical protein VGR62_05330 [Candidatus Binatia bacterium]|jgi:hypothetical protein|nr:hypothetical protein [Candidatus Binatia bacterium]
MRPRARGAAGLPAALALLAVSTALGAALLELTHTQAVLARTRRNTALALAAADGCLATVVARLPAGWSFADVLAGPDGMSGTSDDGTVVADGDCLVDARVAPHPARLLLDVDAVVGGGRRMLSATVTRATEPGAPALVWLARPTPPASIGGLLVLDGVDVDDSARPAVASIAGPGDPASLDAWIAAQGGHVERTTPDAAPRFSPPPPLAELAARAVAAGAAPGGTFVATPPAPAMLTRVPADLVVATPLVGAGLLIVEGRLDIMASFEFSGVVVAAGGVRVAEGARLVVRGGLWLGPSDPAAPLLEVEGDVTVQASADAVAVADDLLPLPRRARVGGISDPG